MFKSIGNTVDKKLAGLVKGGAMTIKIEKIFKEFIRDSFSEKSDYFKYDLDYDIDSRRLVIRANNKSVANEIALKIRELSKLLKEEKISISNIVIK